MTMTNPIQTCTALVPMEYQLAANKFCNTFPRFFRPLADRIVLQRHAAHVTTLGDRNQKEQVWYPVCSAILNEAAVSGSESYKMLTREIFLWRFSFWGPPWIQAALPVKVPLLLPALEGPPGCSSLWQPNDRTHRCLPLA